MTTKPLPSDIASHIGKQEDPGGRVADIAVWIDRFYILHDTLRDKLYFHCITSFIYPGVSFIERQVNYICNTFYILHDKYFVLKKIVKKIYFAFFSQTKCIFVTT